MAAPPDPTERRPSSGEPSHRRKQLGRALNILVGGALIGALFTPHLSGVLGVLFEISRGSLRTLFAIWHDDGPATLATFLAALARVTICIAPTLSLLFHLKRGRMGVAVWSLIFIPVIPFSLRSMPTPWHWAAGVALSAAGVVMMRWWYLRWAVVLPMIVTIVLPTIDHGVNAYWTPERLAPRCAANDGERPANVRPEQRAAAYYGLHRYADNLWLLTGENERDGHRPFGLSGGSEHAGSWWVTRNAEGHLEFARRSRASGNLWNGCKLGDVLWLLRANYLLSVRRSESGEETVEPHHVEMRGFDAAGLLCDPTTNSLFFMEGMYGQLWQVPIETLKPEPRPGILSRNVGGFLLRREHDGRFVYMNPYQIGVYDPAESRITQSVPAALAAINMDVCQHDGAVVVADMTGRVRLFKADEQGRYSFDWGTSLFAPRRVRFSPDCSHIAVTSANDRDVWLLDRSTHQVVRTWAEGPSIRGLAFTGPRELEVVDACTVTTLRY